MKFSVISLLVLCLAILPECLSMRILNFRREISNFNFNGHSLGVPHQEYFGRQHGKHAFRRWRRNHAPDYPGYGYGAPGHYGYGYDDDYQHYHHKGKGLWRRKRHHGHRYGYGY
ncbi:uncharacterized protein LOC134215503 [Armigeres subalbatus]|uniref:uncharacterized protein LOC134215503 n=1 Tax=Armigeres subalbatus TaxID=124917 RepID=UPI002ED4537F